MGKRLKQAASPGGPVGGKQALGGKMVPLTGPGGADYRRGATVDREKLK